MQQATLIAGDTLDFTTSVNGYAPADGWTLKYRLVPRSALGTVITLTATTSGTDYRVIAIPTTTAPWVPGVYSWSSWVEKSGARQTIDEGALTIEADPSTRVAGFDERSAARIALDNIDDTLANKAGADIAEYRIAGRLMRHFTPAELLVLRDRLAAEVRNEEMAARINKGLKTGQQIRVRWARA
jgi:hypothetical protein